MFEKIAQPGGTGLLLGSILSPEVAQTAAPNSEPIVTLIVQLVTAAVGLWLLWKSGKK